MFRGGVIHSFTGSARDVDIIVAHGFFISVNGKSFECPQQHHIVRKIPLDRLLVETDSPYCGVHPACDAHKEYVKSATLYDMAQLNPFKFKMPTTPIPAPADTTLALPAESPSSSGTEGAASGSSTSAPTVIVSAKPVGKTLVEDIELAPDHSNFVGEQDQKKMNSEADNDKSSEPRAQPNKLSIEDLQYTGPVIEGYTRGVWVKKEVVDPTTGNLSLVSEKIEHVGLIDTMEIRNEPMNIIQVVEILAGLHKKSVEEMSGILSKNAYTLLGI